MAHHGKPIVSQELALASDVFDKFCGATTLKTILGNYRYLCDILHMKPTNFPQFYPKLKVKLCSWRAQALWNKFDKRANHKCYNRGRACPNTRVLIIGAGPCGLRAAIEAQLLGAKVVVIEKRDRMTRNNVLHLWPFVIHDLRALGAKKFFGKFCAGSIDHISIRQLQCILLKVALLLGVEIHEGVSFESLLPPPADQSEEKIGWRAKVSPLDHPVNQYEFDVLIGADGKRNTLEGFRRKEFRGKLAIAITANFINHHTEAEARVEEISGVAYIFNQKFFKDLYAATGIDLENIVYYKDETHYFVMTAKKHSLLNKGVILNDYADTAKLLALDNVDKEALMEYAKEAADFSTNYKLPQLQFAVNHYGQPDVAMFDFTSMYAAENASRVMQQSGHKLLMCLVGDSLLEPFWPTGSGCARGFLSSMDACWAVRSWGSVYSNPLEVIAERESIYRLLAQTTPENLQRDNANYTLDPHTRYPNLNSHCVLPVQVKSLFTVDDPSVMEQCLKGPSVIPDFPKKRRRTQIHQSALLSWLKRAVATYNNVHIEDINKSFKDGLALCGIIHHYRPDLIDFNSLDSKNVARNNQLAFDTLEKEFGILPVMTGLEMEQCEIPDSLAMLSYLTQVYDTFRGEIPYVRSTGMEEEYKLSKEYDTQMSSYTRDLSKLSHSQRISLLSRLSGSLSRKRHHHTTKISSCGSGTSDVPSRRVRKKRSAAPSSSSSFIEDKKKILEQKPQNTASKYAGPERKKEHRLADSLKSNLEYRSKNCTEKLPDVVLRREHPLASYLKDHLEGRGNNYNTQNEEHRRKNYTLRSSKSFAEFPRQLSIDHTKNNAYERRCSHNSINARILKGIQMLQQSSKQNDDNENVPFEDYSMFLYRQSAPEFKERVKDLEKKLLYPDRDVKELQGVKRVSLEEDFSGRVKNIENKLKGTSPRPETKPHDLLRAIGKIEKTDWNVKEIEKKIEENKYGRGYQSKVERVPKWNRQQFDDKFSAMKQKLIDKKQDQSSNSKFSKIDDSLRKLDQKLKNGSVLEQGQRGANKVSAMAAQLTVMNQPQADNKHSAQKSASRNQVMIPSQSGSEICHFCSKRVYLMERLSAEGRFFHRGCFRCEYCSIALRLGNYAFDRDGRYGNRFYCAQHFGLPGTLRMKLRNRNEEYQKLMNISKENIVQPAPLPPESPVLEKVAFSTDSIDTPERVEFENLDVDVEESGEISRNEMDEDEWTDHNFGTSANELASTDEVSDISESEEDEENYAQAIDIPNEPLQMSEKYSQEYCSDDATINGKASKKGLTAIASADSIYEKLNDKRSISSRSDGSLERISYHEFESDEDDSDTATEKEDEIKARELRMQEVRLEVPERVEFTDTGSDTEMNESSIDENETFLSSSSESDEYEESATEISTDSEFERNTSTVMVTSEIPNIVITESAPVRRGYLEDVRKVQIINKCVEKKPPFGQPSIPVVEGLVQSVTRPTPFINPRKGDYFLNRTQSTEGIASKISLELKKKYLLGGSDANNAVKKSGSASVLSTGFKSFLDQISEHQKLLNPAPEPSATMQAFLETTNKLRTSPTLSPTPMLNLKGTKELDGADNFHHVCDQNESSPMKLNVAVVKGNEYIRDTSSIKTIQKGGNADIKRIGLSAKSIELEASILVPGMSNDGAGDEDAVDTDTSTSEDTATEQDVMMRDYSKFVQVQIPLPKLEIHDAQGELLPNDAQDEFIPNKTGNTVEREQHCTPDLLADINFQKVCEENSRSRVIDDCDMQPKSDISIGSLNSKIIAVPPFQQNDEGEKGAHILTHVSTPAGLFLSDSNVSLCKEEASRNSSGSSEKSNSSTPTSLHGDESTLAIFTETELSDWARDEDAPVSENLDDFSLLSLKNITYRKHQRGMRYRRNDRAFAVSKLPAAEEAQFTHVCGKSEGKSLPSILSNTTDIEYMDRADDDEDAMTEEESSSKAINRILKENSGYTEYVSGDYDEAKTPSAEVTSDYYNSFTHRIDSDVKSYITPTASKEEDSYHAPNIDSGISMVSDHRNSNKSDLTESSNFEISNYAPSTDASNSDYNMFVQRLRDRISPFSSVKDSIDVRKSKKNSMKSSTSTSAPISQDVGGKEEVSSQYFDFIYSGDYSSKKFVESEIDAEKMDDETLEDSADSQLQTPMNQTDGEEISGSSYEGLETPVASTAPSSLINTADTKYVESSCSLPDITKALYGAADNLLTPIIPCQSKDKIFMSAEHARENARARARLMSDSELGLSPEEKLKQLKERILSRKAVKSAYKPPVAKSVDSALPSDSIFYCYKRNNNEQQSPYSNKLRRDRRRSIIQAVSDFFLRKTSPSPPATAAASSSSQTQHSRLVKFRIPLKGKEKSKDKQGVQTGSVSDSAGEKTIKDKPGQEEVAAALCTQTKYEDDAKETNDTLSSASLEDQAMLSSRQSRCSKRSARQAHLKRLRMAQEIQRKLEEIEVKQKELENRGVNVEKAIRGEDPNNTKDENQLMQELLELMQERNDLQRYERKLLARAQEIEQQDSSQR